MSFVIRCVEDFFFFLTRQHVWILSAMLAWLRRITRMDVCKYRVNVASGDQKRGKRVK